MKLPVGSDGQSAPGLCCAEATEIPKIVSRITSRMRIA
jgi:hypothetical protein